MKTTSIARYVLKDHSRSFAFLYCLVVVEVLIALYVGWVFKGLTPFQIFKIGDMTNALAGWFIIPLVWLLIVAVNLSRRKVANPTKTLLRMVRYQRPWLIRGLIITLTHLPLARAFATLKVSIPIIHPFYLDPFLADLDRSILGTDGWRITHDLIGVQGTIVIDRLYLLWGTYLLLLAGWISFTRKRDMQIRCAITFNLIWFLIGGVAAISLSSVGPIFYDIYYQDARYVGIWANLYRANEYGGMFALRAMYYLAENNHTTKLGVGISAMPSLHVAIVFFGTLIAFTTWNKLVKIASILFLIVIWFGSVHLGWHYLTDGAVSIVLVLAIWFSARWIVGKFRRPDFA